MPTILDLGEDILASNVCLFLTSEEIFKLSLTCKLIHGYLNSNDAFHRMFISKFGKLTPLNLKDYNWRNLFHLRASRRLNFYTWGSAEQGRLGYHMRDVPQSHKAPFMFGVNTPTKLGNFDNFTIEHISSGGYSFQVLADGNLYCVGAKYNDGRVNLVPPGPTESDYSPPVEASLSFPLLLPFLRRSGANQVRPIQRRSPDRSNLRLPPEEQSFPAGIHRNEVEETQFVTRLKTSPHEVTQKRLVQVSGGRLHILALDCDGKVYTWDAGNSDWQTAVILEFPGIWGRVTRVFAGWNSSCCLVQGVGLVYWTTRECVTREDYEAGSNKCDAIFRVVPNLEFVKDFIALSDCLLYITSDGELYSYSVNSRRESAEGAVDVEPVPLEGFNKWLTKHNAKNRIESMFSKLTGCYRSFTVFTDHELVLLGGYGDWQNLKPQIIPELQDSGVIQVVTGDYHYLALTDCGDLLSWGLESQGRGCLGLGDLLNSSDPDVHHEGRDIRVTKPRNVPKPTTGGKWLAATAGGWHSGALFISTLVSSR